jgi:signal transduction histidine kinase
MSWGPGKIRRGVLKIVTDCYGRSFSVEQISTRVYGDTSSRHMSDVRRSLASMPLPPGWYAVRGAQERARKTFHQKVAISVAGNLPLIRGDANLLQQVLFNLLDNTHKYGRGSVAIIHVRQEGSARWRRPDTEYVCMF